MERLACHTNNNLLEADEEAQSSPSVYNGSFRGGGEDATESNNNVNNDSSYEEQGIFWMDF